MKRFALAMGCAAAALAMAATASAHDRVVSRHGGAGFEIDANQDGWITRAEVSAAADRMFADLDVDNDGRISAEDRQRTRAMHLERAEEARREASRHVRRAERDAERHVERTVERVVDGERRVIIHRTSGDGAHPSVEAPEPPHPPRPPMAVMMFASSEEADLDGDGALSREEFRAQQLRFFDASDANRDGRIRFEPPPAPPTPPEPPAPPARPR